MAPSVPSVRYLFASCEASLLTEKLTKNNYQDRLVPMFCHEPEAAKLGGGLFVLEVTEAGGGRPGNEATLELLPATTATPDALCNTLWEAEMHFHSSTCDNKSISTFQDGQCDTATGTTAQAEPLATLPSLEEGNGRFHARDVG